MNSQLVTPNTSVTDGTGWCLRFTQKVWGAPARYESAWKAWEATQLKHSTAENIPTDVGVVVWFSHYGTYGENGNEYYGNWGHVVSWIPGRGYLSSPTNGVGQKWLSSIQEVERAYSSKYVGWSEDINGVRVAVVNSPQPKPVKKKKEETKMMLAHIPQPDGNLLFLLFGDNFYLEFTGQEAANAFAGQIGSASAPVSQSFFDKVKAEVEAGRK
jgi:hypothetical protein